MVEAKKTETARPGAALGNDHFGYDNNFTAFSTNSSTELEDACLRHMAAHDIPFEGRIRFDGEVHRFSIDRNRIKKDEWLIGRMWEFQGRLYCRCSYGSWSTGVLYIYESWDSEKGSFSAEERAELQRYLRGMEEVEKRAREQRQNEAAKEALGLWQEASKKPISEAHKAYIQLKGIDSYTARFGINPMGHESLILPLWNISGQIRSLQFISVGTDGTVYKSFLSGAEKKGCLFVIGNLKGANSFFISEGFSTAASIHQATNRPVVVAYDAGNLEPVIAALRTKYPHQEIVIAGDDDTETPGNPGRTKAEEAAKAHGCKTIFPKFEAETRLLNGKKPTDFNDLDALKGDEEVRRQLQEQDKVTDKTDATYSDGWQQPIEFEEVLLPVPPFDLALLPEPLQRYVEDAAERMQCPPDFIAVALMVVFSSLIGAGCGIRPKQYDTWTVIPNLWGAIIGPPSILKSPALGEAMAPLAFLEKIADKKQEELALSREANKAEKKFREETLKGRLKKAIDDDNEGQIEAIKTAFAALEKQSAEEPWRRYKTNDSTIEKLAEILTDNPRGILVFRDELIGFLVTLDREDRVGDRAFYLEGWNGYASSAVKSDRIARGTISCNPCISILGGIQPSKLRSYFMSTFNDLSNDGLLQRFQLMIYPKVPKQFIFVDREPDQRARERVINLAKQIAEMDFTLMGARLEGEAPFPVFRFDKESQELFNDWYTALKNRLLSDAEEEIFVQHLGKFPKLMPSLALINCVIGVADSGILSLVTLEDAKRAINWCVYLEAHARRVYSIAERRSFYRGKTLLQKLKGRKLKDRFTLRDVYKNGWSGLSTKEEAKEACEELVERGWLQEEFASSSSKGGQSTVRYRIHLILLKEHALQTDTTDTTDEN